jgi:four helix bundle protein
MQQRKFVLADQLLRSGTSIGANIEEAIQGQSRRDFIAKLSISLKEAHETHYWLRLVRDTTALPITHSQLLITNAEELIRLLTSILKSTKANG